MKIVKYKRGSNDFSKLLEAKESVDHVATVKKQAIDYTEEIFKDILDMIPELKDALFVADEVDDLFSDIQELINNGLTASFNGENDGIEYNVEITAFFEYDNRTGGFFLSDEGTEVAVGKKKENGEFWSFNLEENCWFKNNTIRVNELYDDDINETLIMDILHACPNAGIDGLKRTIEKNKKILELYKEVKDIATVGVQMRDDGVPQLLITAGQDNLIGFEVFEKNGIYYLHNHLCMVGSEGKIITVEKRVVDTANKEEAVNIIRATFGEFKKEFTIVQLLNKNTACFYNLEFSNSPFRECKKYFMKIDENGNTTKYTDDSILDDKEKELVKLYIIKIEKTFSIINGE